MIQKWFFTFRKGSEYQNCYAVVLGERDEARKKMFALVGALFDQQFDNEDDAKITEKNLECVYDETNPEKGDRVDE